MTEILQGNNRIALREFFIQFSSVPFDDNPIEHYGEIRALLSKTGKPIGANDFCVLQSPEQINLR